MLYGLKQIESIFANNGNGGTRFWALALYYLKSSHLFNKPSFEQYLFKCLFICFFHALDHV